MLPLPPPLTKAGYAIAAFIVLTSAVMLPFLDRSTPEYFMTGFCLGLGLVFGTGVWFFSRPRHK
ncbi:MAG TPA: hypothetical protein VNT75_24540 [Symbiobacteriaceae bacterium]|nr:hypothetical protein [Symbiobacteriaceae bacterium]